jgi:hypothetical protein
LNKACGCNVYKNKNKYKEECLARIRIVHAVFDGGSRVYALPSKNWPRTLTRNKETRRSWQLSPSLSPASCWPTLRAPKRCIYPSARARPSNAVLRPVFLFFLSFFFFLKIKWAIGKRKTKIKRSACDPDSGKQKESTTTKRGCECSSFRGREVKKERIKRSKGPFLVFCALYLCALRFSRLSCIITSR